MNKIIPARQLDGLLDQVRACQLCSADLANGPRPVLSINPKASILIVGQAPGTKVHATGIPWNDPSGDRLRDWLQMDKTTFYDEQKIAIMPMGFCYPGKGRYGDLPPRTECAPTWHAPILEHLPNIKVTLLIGQYAQKYYLQHKLNTLTETVQNWQSYLPSYFVLPHPSPRNQIWLKKNPWFVQEVIPELRKQVSLALTPATSHSSNS